MTAQQIGWQYVGPGKHPGVPARNLTMDQFDDLSADGRRIVRRSPAYRPLYAAPPAEKPAKKPAPQPAPQPATKPDGGTA